MSKLFESTLDTVKRILDGVGDNRFEITSKQLVSARDMIDILLLTLAEQEGKVCKHPKQSLINLTTMGDVESKYQCGICGESLTATDLNKEE